MSVRKTRAGKIVKVGRTVQHRYEPTGEAGQDGRPLVKCTGMDHLVQVVVEVSDGPDKGREVRTAMTPDAVRAHIAEMTAALAEAEERQARGSEI